MAGQQRSPTRQLAIAPPDGEERTKPARGAPFLVLLGLVAQDGAAELGFCSASPAAVEGLACAIAYEAERLEGGLPAGALCDEGRRLRKAVSR